MSSVPLSTGSGNPCLVTVTLAPPATIAYVVHLVTFIMNVVPRLLASVQMFDGHCIVLPSSWKSTTITGAVTRLLRKVICDDTLRNGSCALLSCATLLPMLRLLVEMVVPFGIVLRGMLLMLPWLLEKLVLVSVVFDVELVVIQVVVPASVSFVRLFASDVLARETDVVVTFMVELSMVLWLVFVKSIPVVKLKILQFLMVTFVRLEDVAMAVPVPAPMMVLPLQSKIKLLVLMVNPLVGVLMLFVSVVLLLMLMGKARVMLVDSLTVVWKVFPVLLLKLMVTELLTVVFWKNELEFARTVMLIMKTVPLVRLLSV